MWIDSIRYIADSLRRYFLLKIPVAILCLAIQFNASLAASEGKVLHVPSAEFATIQAAVDASGEKSLILVAPGTYRENIKINAKTITLKSACGPKATVLDGNRSGSVVAFNGRQGGHFVIEGFTVTNGSGKIYIANRAMGGGIHCSLGSVEIRGNIITQNTCYLAGGIYLSSKAVVCGNIISLNETKSLGASIYIESQPVECFNNYFLSNKCGSSSAGIYVWCKNQKVHIHHNLFFDNWAFYGSSVTAIPGIHLIEDNIFFKNNGCRGGAVLCRNPGADSVIKNNLMLDNWGCYGGGVCSLDGASPLITGNVILGNTTHNIYCFHPPLTLQ